MSTIFIFLWLEISIINVTKFIFFNSLQICCTTKNAVTIKKIDSALVQAHVNFVL